MQAQNQENATIEVEVAYATARRQEIVRLRVERGTTALEAARRSGLAHIWPELNVETAPMGIFSRPLDGRELALPSEYVLQQRDRVEIYRPLLIDPKQARLARAAGRKR